MICLDNQPFSIVSDDGFTRLLKRAIPNYQIPSDKYFREKVVPDIYSRCKAQVTQKISNMLGKASFTTDIWTCKYTNSSFLSLTIHFFEKTCLSLNQRSHFSLACKKFPGSHTGDAIAEAFNSLLQEWNIKREHIHLVLADNAANMRNGFVKAKVNYEACFIHSLQLVIQDAIGSQRSVSDLIAKSRKIVSHFNHSQTACDKLSKLQEQLNLPKHKLFQDVQTRWNSSFYLLSRLLEQKQAVNLYILDHGTLTDLTFSEWELVGSILNLLKPFEDITKITSSSDCFISEVIPFVSTITAYLNKENANFAGVGTMKEELKNSLNKRFENIFIKKHYTIATFLDPRFKDNFFTKDRDFICEYIITNLKSQIKENNTSVEHSSSPDISDYIQDHTINETIEIDSDDNEPLAKYVRTSEPETSRTSGQNLFWEIYEDFAGEGMSSTKTKTIPTTSSCDTKSSSRASICEKVNAEITEYKKHRLLERKANPISWWQEKREVLPLLYNQALIYLSAPVGSVASEQMFSEAGTVNSAKRNRLNPETTETLIFLHDNLPKLQYSY